MSASGVVSIAFAKTGFVLLCTIPSETLPPGINDLIEMFEDYLTHLASQTRRAVVFKILDDIEMVWLQPVLALSIFPLPHVRASACCSRSNRNKTASPVHRE
jgi:hypothetical protein